MCNNLHGETNIYQSSVTLSSICAKQSPTHFQQSLSIYMNLFFFSIWCKECVETVGLPKHGFFWWVCGLDYDEWIGLKMGNQLTIKRLYCVHQFYIHQMHKFVRICLSVDFMIFGYLLSVLLLFANITPFLFSMIISPFSCRIFSPLTVSHQSVRHKLNMIHLHVASVEINWLHSTWNRFVYAGVWTALVFKYFWHNENKQRNKNNHLKIHFIQIRAKWLPQISVKSLAAAENLLPKTLKIVIKITNLKWLIMVFANGAKLCADACCSLSLHKATEFCWKDSVGKRLFV